MPAKALVAAKPKRAYSPPVHRQLAALCLRKGKSGTEVLLVTSSEGRWILPKGWPINGKTPGEAAMQEAWEEGGVKRGKVGRKALGSFIATKVTDHGDEEPCLLDVFEVKVRKTVSDYPEADRRNRIWVSPKEAAEMVTEDGLREILLSV
ncbi:NUDIX hydrolase [Pseudoroseicyclus tamaricis]|uniref:NUDIX hydrolase n=1 Tax=Pseudoroseicyclus tamaricis TaxID=2705421 RepID=A0A6B2JTZ3_9RHOB|nr:NUDIX hydrolase [Pseudoroseicyclus tamaricis]NDV01758.1 NUDIX hydrolase [Pseudoroseicyclus tamaricis]